MSSKNEIDELFRSALGDKGMNFTPEYWEQMEALIAKRRKKVLKRAIWYSVGLLLLISAVTLTYVEEKEVKVEVEVEEGSTVNSQQSTEEIVIANDQQPEAYSLRSELGVGNPRSANKHIRKNDDLEMATAGKREVRIDERDMVRHADIVRRSFFSEGGASRSTPEQTELNDKHNPKPITQNPPSLLEDFDNSTIIQKPGESASQSTIPSLRPESLGNNLQVAQPKSSPLSVENPKKLLRRPPLYTQLYLGSFLNYGWVKHRYDPSIHTWKSANEKAQPFMHYGLNMRASKRGFSLSIGAGIRQWTERTNYTREIDHYTFDTTLRMVKRDFIQRPDGSYAALVRNQIDTTSHTTSTAYICPDCPVSFRYLTLPIAIHYEYGWGKWLGFSEAGMTFSFLSKSSGEYSVQWQNETGKTPGMQTDNLSGKYMSPMVMQAGLTLGIKYRIHPFLSINGHVAYQRSLGSMMTMYRQENDFYGLGVGLEWKLF